MPSLKYDFLYSQIKLCLKYSYFTYWAVSQFDLNILIIIIKQCMYIGTFQGSQGRTRTKKTKKNNTRKSRQYINKNIGCVNSNDQGGSASLKRYVLRHDLKVVRESIFRMSGGRTFQRGGAERLKALDPMWLSIKRWCREVDGSRRPTCKSAGGCVDLQEVGEIQRSEGEQNL